MALSYDEMEKMENLKKNNKLDIMKEQDAYDFAKHERKLERLDKMKEIAQLTGKPVIEGD